MNKLNMNEVSRRRWTKTGAAFAATAAAVVLPLGLATPSHAEDIAYWSFNNRTTGSYQTTDFPYQAEFGSQAGTATFTVDGGITDETTVAGGDSLRWIESRPGTTVNAQFGEVAGGSVVLLAGPKPNVRRRPVNGNAWFDIAFDASLLQDIELSFAALTQDNAFSRPQIQLFNGTEQVGPLNYKFDVIQFPSDGVAPGLLEFSDFEALAGVADARIRILGGGVSDNSPETAWILLDNVRVTGTVVPEPASLALLAAGGLLIGTARRRKQTVA